MRSSKDASRREELVHQIKGFLAPSVFQNEEERSRRVKVLNSALISILALIPVIVISNLLGGKTPVYVNVIDTLGIILFMILFYWLRKGRIRLVSLCLMVFGFIGITAAVANLGTIRAPTTAMYLPLIIIAGLLFEFRGMIVTTIISSLLVGGLIISENMGLLPIPNYSVTFTQWITYTAIFAWAGSLTFSSIQSLHNALEHADDQLVGRKKAEAELAKHRDQLEELIEEGTAELEAKNAILFKEIAERKLAEGALREERDRAEKYLNIVEVIIVALDIQARITLLNRKGHQVLGYKEGELIGRDWINTCLRPQERNRVHGVNKKINAGEIEAFEYYESYILTKKGEERFIAWHTTILKDENSQIIGTLSSGEDITERRKAEKTLQEEKTRYRELFNNISSGVAIYKAIDNGNDFVFQDFNKAGERLDGDRREDIVGRSILDVRPGAGEYGILEVLRRVWKTGIAEHIPATFYRDNRLSGWYENYIYKLPSGEIVAVYDNVSERRQAEEALRDSEKTLREQFNFLQQLIDSIPNPLFYKDTNGVYIGCNKAFEVAIGYSKEEIVGHTVFELYPKEIADIYHEADNRLFQDPGVQIYETSMPHADGSKHTAMFSKATYFDTEGRLAGLVGIILDITERKHMEIALRESERRLADIIDFLPDATFVIDDMGKVIAWNHAIEEMTGINAQDILGRGDYEYSLPFYGEKRPLLIDLALEPQPEIEKEYSDFMRVDSTLVGYAFTPNLRESGAYLWGVASPIYNSQGNIVGAIESIKDITEQKRMEKDLQESKDYLNKIINSIGDPLFVKDREHKITLVNNAACKLFGRPREDLLGRMSSDLFPLKEMAEISWKNDEEVFNAGVEVTSEETSNYGDKTLTFLVKKTPYTDNKGNQFLVGITRDITDRKQAEDKMIASLREKEILLKEVHHRVKNNLQVISTLLYLQSLNFTDDNIIKVFEDSQNRIKSMALIHENLYKSDNLGKVDFNDYIKQLMAYLSLSNGDLLHKINFKINSEDIFLNINTAIPCGMIINELVSNSIKHAFPDGGNGEICIDLSSEGDNFKLIISDNGIGIKCDLNIKDSKTLGFRLIDTLVRQIDGKMSLDTTNGTRCEIHFRGLN